MSHESDSLKAVMNTADWHMWWKRSGARGLRQILMEEWDPIGVKGHPEAVDEYDGYLPQVASRLRADATTGEIATFLTEVEEDRMGLGRSPAARMRNRAVAAHIRTWYTRETAAPES
jgi:hypothetical protein